MQRAIKWHTEVLQPLAEFVWVTLLPMMAEDMRPVPSLKAREPTHTGTTHPNTTATRPRIQRQKYHFQAPNMRSPPQLHGCRKTNPPSGLCSLMKFVSLMGGTAAASLHQHPGLEGTSTLPGDEGGWSHSPARVELGQPCPSEVPVKITVVNKIRQPRLGATFFSEVS